MSDAAQSDAEAYVDCAALTDLFGDHPKTKILAVLLTNAHDSNITQIADDAEMSRSTVYNHIDDLTELGVIEETREMGGGSFYQINQDNAAAELLAQTEWELIEQYEN